jgi:hypothetical protein
MRTGGPLQELLLEFDVPYNVPLRFGLMVGDAANNMRSTLDVKFTPAGAELFA